MKKSILAILAAMAAASAAMADTALYFNGSTYISLGKCFPLGHGFRKNHTSRHLCHRLRAF